MNRLAADYSSIIFHLPPFFFVPLSLLDEGKGIKITATSPVTPNDL